MRNAAEASTVFREISSTIGSLDPIETKLERIEELARTFFPGSFFSKRASLAAATTYVCSTDSAHRGYQLLVPRAASGQPPSDALQTRVAQALVDAFSLLIHRQQRARRRERGVLELEATKQLMLAMLSPTFDKDDWTQTTEAILTPLFAATVRVFTLAKPPLAIPVVRWAVKVGQPLCFANLPARGIQLDEDGVTIQSVVTAIDRRSEHMMTISSTEPRSFDAASLATATNCLRIYQAGLQLTEHSRQRSREESLLTTILSSVDLGILGMTENGQVLFANRAAGELLGSTPQDLVHDPERGIITQLQEYLPLLGASQTPWLTTNMLLRKPSGKPQPAAISLRQVASNLITDAHYLITLADTTRSHYELEEWRWHASHDPLTGILNRAGLANELKTIRDRTLMVLFIDINRFKTLNDLFGHQGGDRVITTVAQRLSAVTKPTDIIARVGGDEFVVVGSVEANFRSLRRVAQRIIEAVTSQPVEIGDRRLAIAVSAGAALEEFHGTIDTLLARADHAMYDAKRTGQSLTIARGDDHQPSQEVHLVDPTLFDFLRARDAIQLVPLERGWWRLSDHNFAASDLTLGWRESARETPRNYAMRNHLAEEYNWLLLHHLLRRSPIGSFLGFTPIAPQPRLLARLERLSRAGYLDPTRLQLTFFLDELRHDDALHDARTIAIEARSLGLRVALRWRSGEGGTIETIASLHPDQLQIDTRSWPDRSATPHLINGLVAFANRLDVQVAILNPPHKLLTELLTPRVLELIPQAIVRY